MTHTDPIRRMLSTLESDTLIETLTLLDAKIDDPSIDTIEKQADRLVRSLVYTEIEGRFPWIDAALEEWALSVDDLRSYSEVVLAEYAAVKAGE
jgi:hypothetical protein